MSGKRVRVLVTSRSGKVLLVKTWLGVQRWSLPGGGIGKGELPLEAAVRELREETALIISPNKLRFIGEKKAEDNLQFDLIVYSLEVEGEELSRLSPARNLEIIGRRWFEVGQFPRRTSELVSWALDHRS